MKKKQFFMVLVSILTINSTSITSFGATNSKISNNMYSLTSTNDDNYEEVSIIERSCYKTTHEVVGVGTY